MASIVVSGDISGAVTLQAPAVAGTTTLTLPTTSGTIVTTAGATSLTTSGNLTFTGTGNRITGDFSNATLSNRVAFQTSTTNGNSVVSVLPNGTANIASYDVFNTSDPTNSVRARFGVSATALSIESSISGTGSYVPMIFQTGGSERLRIDTSGNVGIGTSSPILGLTIKNDSGSTTYGQRSGSLVLESNNFTGGGGTDVVWSTGTQTNQRYASVGSAIDGNDGAGGSRGNIVFATKATSDATTLTERFRIGSAGQLGIGGANYGTSGQVLTSNGSGSAPSWQSPAGNPTGTVLMWSTNSAPSGYLLCDGSNVSRSTFAALFAVIGTTYGAGDGSTTFGLPNFTNRMPIGSGGTYGLAATGGSATTTLSTTNLPAHNHSISVSNPAHNHTYSWGFQNGSGPDAGPSRSGFTNSTSSTTTGITANSANTGDGAAFNTISPYLGIRFIIKT